MKPRGFALMAALWLVTGAAFVVLAASLAAREAIRSASNRVALTRASWTAEGCSERIRAQLDRLVSRRVQWESLADSLQAGVTGRMPCRFTLRPAGYAVDMNATDGTRLRKLLSEMGVPALAVDSLADAFLDWRDADGIARPLGAEEDWYRSEHRITPRNGPFASIAELALVRGWDRVTNTDSVLSVEAGRTPLNLASLAAVASLPGVTRETATRLAERRRRGERLRDLSDLAQGVSGDASDSLGAHRGELASIAVIEPEAWILTASATTGLPPVTATVELRLAPAEARAAIVRKRVW